MALAHSRGTSCDSFGGQDRYEPSPNILTYSRQFLVFCIPQGGTEKSDSLSGIRHEKLLAIHHVFEILSS